MQRLKSAKSWLDEYQQCIPMQYVTSQWQKNKKNTPYFLYRLISFVWFIEALVLSFIDVRYMPAYWAVYYTHWSFTLATIQSCIALVLVAMNQADAFNPKGGRIQNRVCKVYEYIHAAATTQALAVTLLFWVAIYDPKNGSPNIQTIQVHAINSVMMLLDLLLVAFPVRAITILLPFLVSSTYLLFNFLYYLAGGKRYDGKPFIYSVLDWTKPGRSAIFSAIVAVIIVVLFGLIWTISLLRRLIHSKITSKKNIDITDSRQSIHISTIA